jgi:hypothetical protein
MSPIFFAEATAPYCQHRWQTISSHCGMRWIASKPCLEIALENLDTSRDGFDCLGRTQVIHSATDRLLLL